MMGKFQKESVPLFGSIWKVCSWEKCFVNDSDLGIRSRKMEWPLRRHTSQHLGKLVINGKLLDQCLIFPVRMFLGNNPVVAEWFWDVVDMGLSSCTGY